MTPKVSVIIRTSGRPALQRAIESVAQQGRSDVEVVAVAAAPGLDPVSSDRCSVRWLAADAPRHPCAAANAGLAAAQGQFLVLLAENDWLRAGHLDKLVDAMEKSPDAVLAYTGVRIESETGEFVAQVDAPFAPWQLMAENRIPIGSALFRGATAREGRCEFDVGLDELEDWDFLLQLQKRGRFVHVPGVSAVHVASAPGSAQRSARYGGEAYRRLWRKWGGAYDVSWLADLFEQVRHLPDARPDARPDAGTADSVRESERFLMAQLERVATDLDAVLGSNSWRLTSGLRRLALRLREVRSRMLHGFGTQAASPEEYANWIEQHDGAAGSRAIANEIADWPAAPLLSVVMALRDPSVRFLREALESVRTQAYPHWELLIAEQAGADSGIRNLLDEYARRDARVQVLAPPGNAAGNAPTTRARGEFVLALGEDDRLPEHALFELAQAIYVHPDAGLIYSDEDRLSEDGTRYDPHFKPDYNYELLLGQNVIGRMAAYRRSLLERVGWPGAQAPAADDHDLALRCTEQIAPAQVKHLAGVLYHRRAPGRGAQVSRRSQSDTGAASLRAVREHLARSSPGAIAEPHPDDARYCRVRFPLPDPPPMASIIVPTRNAHRLLRACLDSIFATTRYPNYEVIVVDNGSDEPALLDYLEDLKRAGRIAVIRDPRPFNFAALNNRATAASRGEFVVLLNNDIEIVEGDWLGEMVSVAARPGVGAVGARLWYPDRTLQHGGVIVGLGGVAGHAHHQLARGNPGYFGRAILLQNVTAVTAACLLVRRSIYDEVGGLDEENLPIAFNDVDFCLKIAAAGYRNVWTPHAQMIHHESATRGNDLAPARIARFHREVRFMHQKWGNLLARDPAFNVNLSLSDPKFKLGDAPRN